MFKMIYNIAKAELQMLFFSPVAWLLLIIFTVQAALLFTDAFQNYTLMTEMGFPLNDLSMNTFAGFSGLFTKMQGYLYFYIPLLTMGLVSRELSSGSIRLLYSSPITNVQIILGKYFSMMIYGAIMMLILLIFIVFSQFTIKDFELPAILSGLLGLYLLVCAYAAIGIFMSSLTSYQIVAAIGTLAVFMGLSMVGRYGQEYDIVRDITWWLSINGRAGEFINGMVCSEDVIYFVVVIALFLALTIIRLNAVRQKTRFSITLGKNIGVILLACILGYLSSRPQLMAYYDATHTKRNTLTQNSQDIIARMEGGITITSYVNILGNYTWFAAPSFLNPDRERFKQYMRFKPEIKLEYVYYYDSVANPMLDRRYPDLNLRERMVKMAENMKLDSNKFISPEEIRKRIDLVPEGNMFVRQIVRENGEKTWLRIFDDMQRFPSEAEITAAFKRIVMKLPKVGFLQGQGERSFVDNKDRSYSMFANHRSFRYALMNQGFDIEEVHLDKTIPGDVDILVIADMFRELTTEEEGHLQQYIDRGGNLFILGEPRRREIMNPLFRKFGFEMVPGILVKDDSIRLPDIIASYPLPEAEGIAYQFGNLRRQKGVVATPTCAGLEKVADVGYTVTPLFRTDTVGVWNELETRYFTDEDTVRYNPAVGEIAGTYHTIVALSRKLGEKEQKILLSGDADCISNSMGRSGIRNAMNYSLITGGFFWMSDHEVPIDVRRPPLTDNEIFIGKRGAKIAKVALLYLLPVLLFILAIVVWIRRRGR